jgi:nucleoside-diphosphate-sugar epimerase
MAEAYHRSFGIPVVTVRPFNTYGPRQSTRAVIPTIITQLLAGVEDLHLGSLRPTRDLTFVTDTCAGFIALGSCDEAVGRDINLGAGREIAIGDLAALLMDITGSNPRIVSEEERLRPDGSEVERLLSDTSLVREICGWQPQVTLRDGLRRTVAWFSEPAHRVGHKLTYTV